MVYHDYTNLDYLFDIFNGKVQFNFLKLDCYNSSNGIELNASIQLIDLTLVTKDSLLFCF